VYGVIDREVKVTVVEIRLPTAAFVVNGTATSGVTGFAYKVLIFVISVFVEVMRVDEL
jgi:hypothetical protein